VNLDHPRMSTSAILRTSASPAKTEWVNWN
jgi:hypothetical protein